MRAIFACAVIAATAGHANAKTFDDMFPGHKGYEYADVNEALRSFDYQQGTVLLPGGQARLEVPEGYYYLFPQDANVVLTFLWGNPEAETLGMVFPAGMTPWDHEVWGADINFDAIGYVSDHDAEGYDYTSLMREMQADARVASAQRVADGYDTFELLGWAEAPRYDKASRKLHWAMELKFGGADANSLNYSLRALGREGVMTVNFIAGMDQLAAIKTALPDVAGMVSFVDGKTYADFDPSVDQVAAVGVAGLIAGKVLASKAGFLAVALLFLKKFGILLLLPLVWLKNAFRRS